MPEYRNHNGVLIPVGVPAETKLPKRATAGVTRKSETGADREFLRPLVEQWIEKIRKAHEAKGPFNEIANQCDAFFSRASGFMWKKSFKDKYIGRNVNAPKFEVTLQKAFELVAVFGPYLFWKYPNVFIESEGPVDITPDLFADLGGVTPDHPFVQQMYQQAVQYGQGRQARSHMRNTLMQRYLNYAQREQPGGGLAAHADLAITEALVKGRSCVWVETYQMPGSPRLLTQLKWRTVDRFLVDPDCKDPTLTDAWWIALQHVDPYWQVEQKFGLPRGTLENVARFESLDSRASNTGDVANMHRRNGQTHDLIVWYEIWSKAGVGTRQKFVGEPGKPRLAPGVSEELDNAVGDFAYICVAEDVPWPLNAPREKVSRSTESKELADMFEWRSADHGEVFPIYADGRWPVAMLDFYRKYGTAWPLAPLSGGLGHLVIMNVFASAFTEQAYDNRKMIVAYLESAAKNVEQAIQGDMSPAFVKINEEAHRKINEMVQILQRPEMNTDLLKALEWVSDGFDKASGLTELMYGMNVGGATSRTAKDISVKEEKASIRPEKMSGDVARWLTEAFDLQKFLAGFHVRGEHISELFGLGPYGSFLWNELIGKEDPEVFLREMKATVEANDIRKPNKERLLSNVQQMLDKWVPMLQAYAQDTGDTDPVNAFAMMMGEALDQDMGDLALGPWRPQPSEEQQQMAEIEMQKGQLEAQKAQVELEKARAEAIKEIATGDTQVSEKQLEFLFGAAEHTQQMRQDEDQFQQKLAQDREKFLQDLVQAREKNRVQIEGMRDKAREQAKTNGSTA